jgi:hypothetical protein
VELHTRSVYSIVDEQPIDSPLESYIDLWNKNVDLLPPEISSELINSRVTQTSESRRITSIIYNVYVRLFKGKQLEPPLYIYTESYQGTPYSVHNMVVKFSKYIVIFTSHYLYIHRRYPHELISRFDLNDLDDHNYMLASYIVKHSATEFILGGATSYNRIYLFTVGSDGTLKCSIRRADKPYIFTTNYIGGATYAKVASDVESDVESTETVLVKIVPEEEPSVIEIARPGYTKNLLSSDLYGEILIEISDTLLTITHNGNLFKYRIHRGCWLSQLTHYEVRRGIVEEVIYLRMDTPTTVRVDASGKVVKYSEEMLRKMTIHCRHMIFRITKDTIIPCRKYSIEELGLTEMWIHSIIYVCAQYIIYSFCDMIYIAIYADNGYYKYMIRDRCYFLDYDRKYNNVLYFARCEKPYNTQIIERIVLPVYVKKQLP